MYACMYMHHPAVDVLVDITRGTESGICTYGQYMHACTHVHTYSTRGRQTTGMYMCMHVYAPPESGRQTTGRFDLSVSTIVTNVPGR